MNALDFTRLEYDEAAASSDESILEILSEHPSRYVRARVAGNPNTPRHIRDRLRERATEHTAVLIWLLNNPAFTREEFTAIYADYIGQTYNDNAHISLASSQHATTRELATLLRLNQWNVTISVLNNYQDRDLDEYRALIKSLVPEEELDWKAWTEIQKLAYFRTTGKRLPPNTND